MSKRVQPFTSTKESTRAWRFSSRGFTLMEVMITVAVGGVLMLGSSYLFVDIYANQKRNVSLSALKQMRLNLMSVVSNRNASGVSAWTTTVADIADATGNPAMACILNHTPCTKDVVTPLNLKYVDGSEAFYSRIATRGVTFDGRVCDSFSTATGTNACPFRWNISWVARCVGTAKTACDNADIEVLGDLEYSPGPGNVIGSAPKLDGFSFRVLRESKVNLNIPIVFTYERNTGIDGSVGEVGNCYQQWWPRQFNLIVSDPGNNVSLPSTNSFRLTRGSYECRIQAPGFKNGSNTIRLNGGSLDFTSTTSFASAFGAAGTMTSLQATFSIAAATTFQVLHHCSSKPDLSTSGTQNNDWMLGIPSALVSTGYDGVRYTIVSCVKTNNLD